MLCGATRRLRVVYNQRRFFFRSCILCPILWRINVSIIVERRLLHTGTKSAESKVGSTFVYMFWRLQTPRKCEFEGFDNQENDRVTIINIMYIDLTEVWSRYLQPINHAHGYELCNGFCRPTDGRGIFPIESHKTSPVRYRADVCACTDTIASIFRRLSSCWDNGFASLQICGTTHPRWNTPVSPLSFQTCILPLSLPLMQLLGIRACIYTCVSWKYYKPLFNFNVILMHVYIGL